MFLQNVYCDTNDATKIKCNHCNANVSSVVVQTPRKDTCLHVSGWPLFDVSGWPLFSSCCCCSCEHWFVEWRHYCGNCEKELGIYKKPYTVMCFIRKVYLITLIIGAAFVGLFVVYFAFLMILLLLINLGILNRIHR